MTISPVINHTILVINTFSGNATLMAALLKPIDGINPILAAGFNDGWSSMNCATGGLIT